MAPSDDWVEVAVFNYRHEAEVARSVLEGSGIVAVVRSDDAGGQEIGLQFIRGARLLVQRRDEDQARATLANRAD
jgi:hypothetical protein